MVMKYFSNKNVKYSRMTKEVRIQIAEQLETCHILISGMTNVKCVQKIEETLYKDEGINHVSIILLKEKAEIKYNPEYLIPSQIATVINNLGYSTKILDKSESNNIETLNLSIQGMTCASCVYKVQKECKKLKGFFL